MSERLETAESVLLPPMPPAARDASNSTENRRSSSTKTLRYVGNLGEYGEMIGEALRVFLTREDIAFEVRGGSPCWAKDFQAEMRSQGVWDGFIPRDEMIAWLSSSDLLLVAMSFSPDSRRQVETSFPSKLVEYAALGRPIVVWGPEYCSAIRWAKSNAAAFCVTEPSPESLANAISTLQTDDLDRLASAAKRVSDHDFNPEEIQAIFVRSLHSAIERFSKTNFSNEIN